MVQRGGVRGRRVGRRVGRRLGQQRGQVVRVDTRHQRGRALLGQHGRGVRALRDGRGGVALEGRVGGGQAGEGSADVEGAVGHLGLDVGRRRRLDRHRRRRQVQLALVALLETVLPLQQEPGNSKVIR